MLPPSFEIAKARWCWSAEGCPAPSSLRAFTITEPVHKGRRNISSAIEQTPLEPRVCFDRTVVHFNDLTFCETFERHCRCVTAGGRLVRLPVVIACEHSHTLATRNISNVAGGTTDDNAALVLALRVVAPEDDSLSRPKECAAKLSQLHVVISFPAGTAIC